MRNDHCHRSKCNKCHNQFSIIIWYYFVAQFEYLDRFDASANVFCLLFFRWRFIACRKMHQINCVELLDFCLGDLWPNDTDFSIIFYVNELLLSYCHASLVFTMQNVALQQWNSKCVMKTALGSMTRILYTVYTLNDTR